MTDAERLTLQFLREGGLGGGRSASALRRFLKKQGISVGYNRAVRLLREAQRAEWVIENEWEALGPNGKVVKLRQTKAKIRGGDPFKAVLEFAKSEIKPLEPPSASISNESLVAVLSIPDIHVGKLAWEEEVGNAYDTKRAVKTYLEAASHLLDKLRRYGVGRILYVVGNDLLHVDGGVYPATTKGTIQDTDTRWQYAFRRAREATASVIKHAAEFANIDVVISPGNHDRVLSFTLGEVLAAYFSLFDNVSVDNSPSYRKYKRYGRLLFGITHGDLVKPQSLPALMATEAPRDWGETTHREWFLGHIHKKKEWITTGVDEHNGIRLRYLPSLAGVDRWHYEMGYQNMRSAEAHIYQDDGYQEASFYYTLRGE